MVISTSLRPPWVISEKSLKVKPAKKYKISLFIIFISFWELANFLSSYMIVVCANIIIVMVCCKYLWYVDSLRF